MRKQILVVMASFMMMSSAFPTYAATVVAGGASASAQEASATQNESSDGINWIIPREGYKTWEHDGHVWWKAEAVAQAQKWAEDNKGDIPSIADERARYEAVASKVCDFLTYDDTLNYGHVHIAYSIRDGKGVCSDYVTLAKALCDIVGIDAKVSSGANMSAGLGHDMLKVTLNGKEYYSDLSAHDAYGTAVLSESAPNWYKEDSVSSELLAAAIDTGNVWESDSIDVARLSATIRGEVAVSTSNGIMYISRADSDRIDAALESGDMATILAIYDSYGIPHAN